jgi:5-formyltetrahydrofolate cyclo-ligase
MHDVERLAPPKSDRWEDVSAWRKLQREALIRARPQDPNENRLRSGPILDRVSEELCSMGAVPRAILGIYWPFRGEIDVRELAHQHIAAGGVVALPVVVAEHAAVEFWRWRPEVPMERGRFNIPIPGERDVVTPDVLIVPLVCFDRAGYRLGYGGGYYDRTLAAAAHRPHTIGIAFAEAELETICPQPHDIPMSRIVTERFAFEGRYHPLDR